MKSIKLRDKIILLASLIIIIFMGFILFYIVPRASNIIESRTTDQLTQLVELPISEINRQYQLFESGAKSETQAKTDALSAIEGMRYADSNYFWVNDYDGVMIMHCRLSMA